MTENQDYWTNQDFEKLGYRPAVTEERIRLSKKLDKHGKENKKGTERTVLAIKPCSLDFIVHREEDVENALSLVDMLPEDAKSKASLWLTYDGNQQYNPNRLRKQLAKEQIHLSEGFVPVAVTAACTIGFFIYPQIAHAVQNVIEYLK